MNFFTTCLTNYLDRRGFITISLLLIIGIIAAAVWFFKHNNVVLPSLPTTGRTQPTQRTPPATGVEFSTERQTPEIQTKKYYQDQQERR